MNVMRQSLWPVSVWSGAIGGVGANHHRRQSLVFLDIPILQLQGQDRVHARQGGLGVPPGDAARRLLEDAEQGVDRIARSCGFGDEERMRTTFQLHLAISPRDHRRRFPLAAVPPAYPLVSLDLLVSNHREEMMTGVDIAHRHGATSG